LGYISDLEKAIAIQRKLIISTPLNSPNRLLGLSDLGNSYRRRYERFGDVKDLDSAIRHQSKAIASIPRDSTQRPAVLMNLGNAYAWRFDRFRKKKDIDFAIDQMLEAVTTSPFKGADRAKFINNIGNLYLSRFEQFGNIQDLESAIEQQLEAVVSISLNSADRCTVHTSLGKSYLSRFERFGAMKDIDFAIEQQLKAAASVPLNSVFRPNILKTLGDSYQRRFEGFGNIQDLESAIKHRLEAVASIPPNHPARPGILNNLGSSYQLRFERFGKKRDIDFAIEQQLEVVASAPPNSPERAGYLSNLGTSYLSRFRHFGEMNDADSAINHHLEALASALPNSANRDTFLRNLGNSYQSRFGHSGHVKDIDSAIERHLEAVASIPLDSSQRPEYLNCLGSSYRSRFVRFEEVKDIDLAIKHQLEAVTSTPLESAKRAGLLNNLGISYRYRFKRFWEMKDNDSSIKLLHEAVSSTPLDDPNRLICVNYLGSSYADRFVHSGDVKDIDLAIKEQLEAVASVPIDSPHRSRFLDQLGYSYSTRFERFGDVKDLDLAIKQLVEAIASASLESANRSGLINNLGNLYLYRFERFREVKDNNFAIENLLEAVATTPLDSPMRPICLHHLGNSYLNRFKTNQEPTDLEESISNFRLSSLSPKGQPSLRIKGSLQWARLAHDLDNLQSASEAYDQAIRLLPQVAWIGLNAIAQLKELSSGIQTLGCNAAACMIALAQAEHHNRQRHLGRALELLDQGRSILWSQTSNFKQDLEDLRGVDSDLASDLDNVGKFLAQGCFRDPNDPLSETDGQLYRRYAEKWEELVHRIRGLPGFHLFLLPLTISTLQTAAAEGPVVIINSSKYRCDAVIVPSQGDLVLVPLPDITAAELESLANQQEEFASRKSKSVWIPSKNYNETLEQVLNRTWLLVGEPIAQKFQELGLVRGSEVSSKSRVWWCLTGSLFFLPIHASFPPTKPGIASIGMMDIVVSSYTPTISTLLRAQQRNKLKRPTFRMLAVGQSSIAGMTPLPGVTEEIAFIQKILGVEVLTLDECKATVDDVAASLPTCSWAHFACHGVQDPDKPMDSGLVMWDRHLLTLSRLAQGSLASAEFAFLSCCESAKGSKQFPNEAMHLAAGLQFIGYRGVIGTLWSVGDKDALSVAVQIYGELFKGGTGRASASKAALALHQAVLLLRANNVPLARWVPFVHFGL
jgi:CHAT domain-containing protein/tetratricopeptide (TPR) repeat protein